MTHCKKILGLTGGISSGKSTVSDILIEKGFDIVDMDKISREIFEIDKSAYGKIVENFGKSILTVDKEIDRKKLRDIVFNDKKKLKLLNSITHPEIMSQAKTKIDNVLETKDIVFVDIPLLFETKDILASYDILFDEIILVYVSRDIQIERLINRDKIDRTEALKIIESQMDIEEKKKMADIIIDNSGNLEELKIKVNEFLSNMTLGGRT